MYANSPNSSFAFLSYALAVCSSFLKYPMYIGFLYCQILACQAFLFVSGETPLYSEAVFLWGLAFLLFCAFVQSRRFLRVLFRPL